MFFIGSILVQMFHTRMLIEHPGFAFIEAVVPCPTEYGKRNAPGNAVAMLEEEKARSVDVAEAAELSAEELRGKIVTGILHIDSSRPEYQRSYAALVARAEAEAAAEAAGNETGTEAIA